MKHDNGIVGKCWYKIRIILLTFVTLLTLLSMLFLTTLKTI